MIIHLIDGTYELFRHYYGLRRVSKGAAFGAVAGVLGTVIQMIEGGATHIGVATDHVIESFRNDLWPGYKTGEGIDPELFAQFPLLEEALVAAGIASRCPYFARTAAADFAPQPASPGKPSAASPTSAK